MLADKQLCLVSAVHNHQQGLAAILTCYHIETVVWNELNHLPFGNQVFTFALPPVQQVA